MKSSGHFALSLENGSTAMDILLCIALLFVTLDTLTRVNSFLPKWLVALFAMSFILSIMARFGKSLLKRTFRKPSKFAIAVSAEILLIAAMFSFFFVDPPDWLFAATFTAAIFDIIPICLTIDDGKKKATEKTASQDESPGQQPPSNDASRQDAGYAKITDTPQGGGKTYFNGSV